MPPNAAQISVTTYTDDKNAGKASIVDVGGVPHYTRRKFDPDTGLPSPEVSLVDPQKLADAIAKQQRDIEQLQAMLVDANKVVTDAGGIAVADPVAQIRP